MTLNTGAAGTRLRFTKMHGAGNDFVMLDGVRQSIALSPAQYKFLGDRRFGVGADQILLVEQAKAQDIDFSYRIFNADGGEVEQCGNGARCFVRFVRDEGLTEKDTIRVQTMNGVISPAMLPDGTVRVDMGAPKFEHEHLPFTAGNFALERVGVDTCYWLASEGLSKRLVSLVSMGNPHAVMLVESTESAAVGIEGPKVQALSAFPKGVNVGFLQILSSTEVNLRVYERGAGETLACGSGACAAVVAGIRRGVLSSDTPVLLHALGGDLRIQWNGDPTALRSSVFLSGEAQVVYRGEITIPNI